MEEILFTYKTKVEDKLAAEGKALPKVSILFLYKCLLSKLSDKFMLLLLI